MDRGACARTRRARRRPRRSRRLASRWTHRRARLGRWRPGRRPRSRPPGRVRAMCPRSSGVAPIGSLGTIHAPRRTAASHTATKVGELVSARCTALAGATPWLARKRAARDDDHVELAVGPLQHLLVRALEHQERSVGRVLDHMPPHAGEGARGDRLIHVNRHLRAARRRSRRRRRRTHRHRAGRGAHGRPAAA